MGAEAPLHAWRVLDLFELDRTVQFGDVLTIVTVFLALAGGLFSLNRFRQTLKQSTEALQSAHYSELDRFYAEILKTGIEHPHLRNPAPLGLADGEVVGEYRPYADEDSLKRSQYETYAYTVWNFLETIHDRCADDPGLRETWTPVIDAENDLHRGWFINQMRREWLREAVEGAAYRSSHKFCLGFRIFIHEYQWHGKDWRYRKRFARAPRFA